MLQEANGQVHWISDIYVGFLVCFREIKGIDIEWSLDSSIVDQAVHFRVIFQDFGDERRDNRDTPCIKNVVSRSVTEFLCGL